MAMTSMTSFAYATDPTVDLVSKFSSISIEDTSDLPGDALNRVPDEILDKIFIHCLPREPIWDVGAAPLLFRFVCRRWRAVADHSTHLWRHLHLIVSRPTPDGDVQQYLEMLDFWFKPGRTFPISLFITGNPVSQEDEWGKSVHSSVHERIRSHYVGRLTSLVVRASDRAIEQWFDVTRRPEAVDRLDRICLERKGITHRSPTMVLDLRSRPASSLYIKTFPFAGPLGTMQQFADLTLYVPWSKLQELFLTAWISGDESYAMLLLEVEELRNLKVLSLDIRLTITGASLHTPSLPSVTLGHVEEFGFCIDISTPESVAMINAFKLPSLKRLMIHRARYNPSYTQTELFQVDTFLGSGHLLTTLQLSDQAVGVNGLLSALGTNPIECLEFSMSSRYLEVLRRLVYDPRSRSPSLLCPALRTLRITRIADSELPLVRRVIESRRGYPEVFALNDVAVLKTLNGSVLRDDEKAPRGIQERFDAGKPDEMLCDNVLRVFVERNYSSTY